jgi:hypothetical protein
MKMYTLAVAALYLGGCVSQTDSSMTKEEAETYYAENGKADGVDFCDDLGWYGDGWCDPWCPLADQDCSDDECTVGADSTCAPGESCTPGYCYFYCPPDGGDCCAPASCEPDEDPGDFCPRATCGPGTVCNEETDSCEPIEPSCASDEDCDADSWCRATSSGGAECVPFVGVGESCGGFTPEWALQRCEPDLTCEYDSDGPTDAPGRCREPESDCRSEGCGEGDYCSFCWGTFQCIPEGAVC